MILEILLTGFKLKDIDVRHVSSNNMELDFLKSISIDRLKRIYLVRVKEPEYIEFYQLQNR